MMRRWSHGHQMVPELPANVQIAATSEPSICPINMVSKTRQNFGDLPVIQRKLSSKAPWKRKYEDLNFSTSLYLLSMPSCIFRSNRQVRASDERTWSFLKYVQCLLIRLIMLEQLLFTFCHHCDLEYGGKGAQTCLWVQRTLDGPPERDQSSLCWRTETEWAILTRKSMIIDVSILRETCWYI